MRIIKAIILFTVMGTMTGCIADGGYGYYHRQPEIYRPVYEVFHDRDHRDDRIDHRDDHRDGRR